MTDEREPMGPIARALVESAREVDDPSERDRARVRARLAATLGVTALSAATSKVAAASAIAEGATVAGTGLGAATSGAGAGSIASAGAGSSAAVAGGLGLGAKATIAATAAAATGAGAGSAAVSSGLWAVLGAKSVASVVAAAALGAAITTAVVVVQREDSAVMAERAARETEARAPQPKLRSQPAPAVHSQRSATPSEPVVTPPVAPNASAKPTSNDARSRVTAPPRTVPVETNDSAHDSRELQGQRVPNVNAASAPLPATRGPKMPDAHTSSSVVRSTLAREGNASIPSAKHAAARAAVGAPSPTTVAPARVDSASATPPASGQLSANLAITGGAQTSGAASSTANPAQPADATIAIASAAPPASTNDAMLDDSLSGAAAAARAPNAARLEGAAQRPAKPAALSGEIQLLASAQRALRDNQLPRALTLLNEHAMRYPSGTLRPEQLAARAVVLCRMGEKNAGRSELQKLQAETPNSPLIRWARDTCGL